LIRTSDNRTAARRRRPTAVRLSPSRAIGGPRGRLGAATAIATWLAYFGVK
jgi:hypothetical protein